MSDLINELKQEHQDIKNILESISNAGNSNKRFNMLQQSKSHLLSHLEKEDEKLYPVLHEHAETDNSLKRTLETFGKEMKNISDFATYFYNKYKTHESIQKPEFSEEFLRLSITLKDRVMKEEIAIYKAYEKLVN